MRGNMAFAPRVPSHLEDGFNTRFWTHKHHLALPPLTKNGLHESPPKTTLT
jgi:hypothetical protein